MQKASCNEPIIQNLGDGKYYLEFDNSTSNGLLRFTHELSLWINDGKFSYAYEIGCGEDWDYLEDEIDDFNKDHPGIIDLALRLIKERGI